MELSEKENEIANPYFNAFDKVKFSDIVKKFQLEDAQMTIFDFLNDAI